MTAHNCLFQVSLFHNDRLLASSEWTSDKDAVIEAMDSINTNHRDIRIAFGDNDELLIVKNGHVLLKFADCDEVVLNIVDVLNGPPPYNLRAAVITKGSGGVTLPEVIKIGG